MFPLTVCPGIAVKHPKRVIVQRQYSFHTGRFLRLETRLTVQPDSPACITIIAYRGSK